MILSNDLKPPPDAAPDPVLRIGKYSFSAVSRHSRTIHRFQADPGSSGTGPFLFPSLQNLNAGGKEITLFL